MLAELQSLAVLASCRPDVLLKTGESGCNWSFNWATCTITADPSDIALRPPDYCRGLILHESAHAMLTRVSEIIPSEFYEADVHLVMNVVEDCRIENWLQQRFPGCRPWIRLYNDRIFDLPADEVAARIASDPAGGFLAGLLDRWWHEVPLLTLHPESASAIEEATPHFNEAIAAFPAPEAPDARLARRSYHAHPVSICFHARDQETEPSPEECIIRMLQHRAWTIAWQHIIPLFRRLLQHPGSGPTRSLIADLASQNAQDEAAAGGGRLPSSGNFLAGSSTHDPGSGSADDYARAVARYGELIESCGATLLRLLTADSRPRRTRFHRSGQALDLRLAMQCEADPRHYEKLWQRTTFPRHPDPAFVLLIDSSGSMDGAKATESFAALVVIREVCLRMDIPLTIIAFSQQARVLQSWDNPLAPGVPSRLAGLLKPEGGTRISPALDLARRFLDESPHRHRHLWILSDGDTEELEGAQRQLSGIRGCGVMVHGLGLGPDSREIATLVRGAQTGLKPQELPSAFAELLGSNLQS